MKFYLTRAKSLPRVFIPFVGIAALAATETSALAQCAPLPSDAVAWWKGENDTSDFLGNSNGTYNGLPLYAEGKVGRSFLFIPNSNIGTSASPLMNFGTGDFTAEFWVNFANISGNGSGMICKDTFSGNFSNYRGFLFNSCDGCGGVGFETRGIASGVGSQTHCRIPRNNFVIGRWYHIAGTRRNGVLRLYVDGALRNTRAEAAPTDITVVAPFTIGSLTPAAPQYFQGQLDEISLYRRALSDAEIAAIAAAGAAGKCAGCPADFNGDGFVDGFDFDDFVSCFEGDPRRPCINGTDPDFNNDGFADGFDYDDFVTAFELGCP